MTSHAKIKLFFILGTLFAVSCHPQGTKGVYRLQIKPEKEEEYISGVDGSPADKIPPYGGSKVPIPEEHDDHKSRIPKDEWLGEIPKESIPTENYPKSPSPKDSYPKDPSPKDPFPNDPYPKDPYPKDPYPKDSSSIDPYHKDPYPKDPYPRDPSQKDTYPRDPYPEDKFNKNLPKDLGFGLWDQDKPYDRSDKAYGHDTSSEEGFLGVIKKSGNFFKCFADGYHWLDCFSGKRPSFKGEGQFKNVGQKGGY